MTRALTLGLIGDYDAAVPAHQAIPLALHRAGAALCVEVRSEWLATEAITGTALLERFDGLWCVPASPYRSMHGALRAIRHARERVIPFLGTCGGFQHAVLEYARNVLGWTDAEHAETAPDSSQAVIALLECPLVEATGRVRFVAGSRLASAYGVDEATEGYRCRYGLNPQFQSALFAGLLRPVAYDDTGEVRAVELDQHPFFVATLFQPERAALRGQAAPLVEAFVRACMRMAFP
jgi:CTP synthase (UTP-ammonia lyase)